MGEEALREGREATTRKKTAGARKAVGASLAEHPDDPPIRGVAGDWPPKPRREDRGTRASSAVLALAFLISTVLGGCGLTTPQPKSPTQEYLGLVAPRVREIGRNLDILSELTTRLSRDPSLTSDAQWHDEMSNTLDLLKKQGQALQAQSAAPAEASEAERLTKRLGDDLVSLADEMTAGAERGEAQSFSAGVARMAVVNATLKQATAEIERLGRSGSLDR